MKTTLGVVMLSMTLAAGAAALAGPEAGKGSERGGRHVQWLAEELGLTGEQQASWKALQEQHRSEMEPLRKEGGELREKLRAAVEAENPDPQAVGAATLALEQHRRTVEAARKVFRERLDGVLTPEQQTKLDVLKAQRRERRGAEGLGRRGGPGRKPAPEAEPPAGAKELSVK